MDREGQKLTTVELGCPPRRDESPFRFCATGSCGSLLRSRYLGRHATLLPHSNSRPPADAQPTEPPVRG